MMNKLIKNKYLREYLTPFFACPKPTYVRLLLNTITSIILISIIEFSRRLIINIENWGSSKISFIIIWAILVLALLKFIIEIVSYKWYWYRYMIAYKRYLWRKYLRKYLLLDNEEVNKFWTWKMIGIINWWIEPWLESTDKVLYWLYNNIIKYIFSLILVFFINPILVIPLIIFTFMSLFLNYFVNEKLLYERSLRVEAENNLFSRMVMIIMEKFTILKNGKINKEIQDLDPLFEKSEYHGLRADKLFVYIDYLPEFLVNVWKAAAISIIVFQSMHWTNVVANLSIILLITSFLSDYAYAIMDSYMNITRDFIYVKRLIDTMDSIETIRWYETWGKFELKDWSIKISNIDFSYKTKEKIFDDFSLDINGWRKIAIVWKSWTWKSTLIKLILWFVRPQKWEIMIDWQDLEDISLKSYYRHIWYLSQDPAVFDWTILDNLIYWVESDHEVTDAEIKKAIDLAQCEFTNKLPLWLQTEIWEKWIRLSWWERQRLAIARLFLQKPDIIILDEPTSSLDSFSESKISKALHNLADWKTMIIIAHRLQTVKEADEIIVVWNNNILERWNHVSLLKLNWEYAWMVDLQSGLIRDEL